jgi:hypothetical protein
MIGISSLHSFYRLNETVLRSKGKYFPIAVMLNSDTALPFFFHLTVRSVKLENAKEVAACYDTYLYTVSHYHLILLFISSIKLSRHTFIVCCLIFHNVFL